MSITDCCGSTKFGRAGYGLRAQSRCDVPLLPLCPADRIIRLDMGLCGGCAVEPAALLIRKGGCAEWMTVCEPEPVMCCGVADMRPVLYPQRSVPVPKPTLIYPLLETDPQGRLVFVLDDKMAQFGFGRWHAMLLTVWGGRLPEERFEDTDFARTDIIFDIDFANPQTPQPHSLLAVEAVKALPDAGC